MDKRKILIIAIIAISISIAGIIAGMAVSGKFSAFQNGSESETETTTEQEEITTDTIPVREKNIEPVSPLGIYIDSFDTDITDMLNKMNSLGFNLYLFELTAENRDSVLKATNTADSLKMYNGIRVKAGTDNSFIYDFCKEANTDFIIVYGLDETSPDYMTNADELLTGISGQDSFIKKGIEPINPSAVSDNIQKLSESLKISFVYIRESEENTFVNLKNIWRNFSSKVYFCNDLSGFNGYTADKAKDTIEVIKESSEIECDHILFFSPAKEIINADSASAKIILNFIKSKETELLDKEFKITNFSKTQITSEQSTVTFKGTSSPLYELTCNGSRMEVADNGDFSVDCKLNPGENKITFKHKEKTYTYNVTYKIKLIKSVSPSSSSSVPGGLTFEVSAIAHKDASMTVKFNGKTAKMTKGEYEGDNKSDIGSDFSYYYANITMPESKSKAQALGSFIVNASYNGITESKKGGSITVSAEEIYVPETTAESTTAGTTLTTTTTTVPTTKETTSETTALTESSGTTGSSESESSTEGKTHRTTTGVSTTESTTESTVTSASETTSIPVTSTETITEPMKNDMELYSYLKNYGLGSCKLCEITEDYVETFDGTNTKTYSVPDCSPLPRGTVDYIKNSAVCDGDTYYFLKSGVKVPLLHEENTSSGSNTKIYHLKVVDGYVMPKNNIKLLSCECTNGKTVIRLAFNRRIAFNAKLLGQTYGDYNGRAVTVSKVNCTGLEFTFSDTAKATGEFSFMDSIISSGSFSTGDNSIKMTLKFSQSGKFYGYHYGYDDQGCLVITIKQKPSSLQNYTIMLDPGHGGYDGGAECVVSNSNFGSEKKINLALALRVKELLEQEGAKVIMTRKDDSIVSLSSRNAYVRNYHPDLFISLHCDSSDTASAYGTSAFYYRAYSQPLAKAIHDALVSAYQNKIYAGQGKSKVSRGASFYAYKVARVEECPAVLIEYGFISNTTECQVLQSSSNREILANATVTGIKNYIANN